MAAKPRHEGMRCMNTSLIDEYVYLVLIDNGWTESRDFLLADSWIGKIETACGIHCSAYAREILHLLGGMKFLEFSPKTGQYFLEKYDGDIHRTEEKYLRALDRLEHLSEKKSVDAYNGAAFAFDAWSACLDLEIVMDLKTAEHAAGEAMFPIGTVEPDGVTCAAESGNIYTLFNDGIFLSGNCIEDYLNLLFIHGRKPKKLTNENADGFVG